MKRICVRFFPVAALFVLIAGCNNGPDNDKPPLRTPEEKSVARATYDNIAFMVELNTGLPHDKFGASLFDIMPQLAFVRGIPYTSGSFADVLTATRCTTQDCVYNGYYGLGFTYAMPPANGGAITWTHPVSMSAGPNIWSYGEKACTAAKPLR